MVQHRNEPSSQRGGTARSFLGEGQGDGDADGPNESGYRPLLAEALAGVSPRSLGDRKKVPFLQGRIFQARVLTG